jgi:hypothetical protein
LSQWLGDPREDEQVRHSVLSLFRQRLYRSSLATRTPTTRIDCGHDPAFQILADQPLGEPLGSTAAWCENDVASAGCPATPPLGSDQSRESHKAVSRPSVLALGEQIFPYFLTHRPQRIELLVIKLSPPAYPWLADLP